MTVTMGAGALAWSQDPEPADVVPYPDDKRAWWALSRAHAVWLALGGLVGGAAVAATIAFTTAAPPNAPPDETIENVDGGAATIGDPPVAAPAIPVIPDGPKVVTEVGDADTAFLSALHTGASGWIDTDSRYISMGRWVCVLVGSGRSVPDVTVLLANTPPVWAPDVAAYFVDTAVHAYCPGTH